MCIITNRTHTYFFSRQGKNSKNTTMATCMQCNAMLKYSTINKRRFWMQNYEFWMNSSFVDTYYEWIWIYCDNFLQKFEFIVKNFSKNCMAKNSTTLNFIQNKKKYSKLLQKTPKFEYFSSKRCLYPKTMRNVSINHQKYVISEKLALKCSFCIKMELTRYDFNAQTKIAFQNQFGLFSFLEQKSVDIEK